MVVKNIKGPALNNYKRRLQPVEKHGGRIQTKERQGHKGRVHNKEVSHKEGFIYSFFAWLVFRGLEVVV